MTGPCKKAVRARQILANENIQLNPVLQNACKMDIARLVIRNVTLYGEIYNYYLGCAKTNLT